MSPSDDDRSGKNLYNRGRCVFECALTFSAHTERAPSPRHAPMCGSVSWLIPHLLALPPLDPSEPSTRLSRIRDYVDDRTRCPVRHRRCVGPIHGVLLPYQDYGVGGTSYRRLAAGTCHDEHIEDAVHLRGPCFVNPNACIAGGCSYRIAGRN